MRNVILQGHVLEQLSKLPDNYVNCCITSPPYFGLRKYSGAEQEQIWGGDSNCIHDFSVSAPPRRERHETDIVNVQDKQYTNVGSSHELPYTSFCSKCEAWRGALGLEPTPQLYVSNLVMVFREVKRVLREDGVVFLNLGDSYAMTSQGSGTKRFIHKQGTNLGTLDLVGPRNIPEGVKSKDMYLIPELVALALRNDGWYIRSRIPWLKKNPMPSSQKDRPTNAVEYVWMLTKNKDYWFDLDAVRKPNVDVSVRRAKLGFNTDHPSAGEEGIHTERMGERFVPSSGRSPRNSDYFYAESEDCMYLECPTQPLGYKLCKGCGKVYDRKEYGKHEMIDKIQDIPEILHNYIGREQEDEFHGSGAKVRVCSCGSTELFSHYASYPMALVKPLILAGTPAWVCGICGKPRERIIKTDSAYLTKNEVNRGILDFPVNGRTGNPQTSKSLHRMKGGVYSTAKELGWSDCGHNNYINGVCLDIFMGSGTVAVVAQNLGRDWLGIELSQEYVNLAYYRIKKEGAKPLTPILSLR